MIETTLENPLTGETITYKGAVSFTPPWRVKSITKTNSKLSIVAAWAQKRGIPIAEASDAARWLLKKECPFCQLASQVLKAIEELGTEKTEEAFDAILAAKATGDTAELERIRKKLWPSEQLESLPQS